MTNITTTSTRDLTKSIVQQFTARANISVDDALPRTVLSIAVPILLALGVLSIIANVFILVSIGCIQIRSKTPLLSFTLSLTTADAWVACVMCVSFIVNSYLKQVVGIQVNQSCLLLVFEAFRMGAMITSVLHLLLLAFNHYLGILRPLHYRTTMTPKVAFVTILLLWILPPTMLLIYFGAVPGQGFQSVQCFAIGFYLQQRFRIVVSLFLFIPLSLMVTVYVHIFIILYNNQPNLKAVRPRQFKRKTKAIWTTFLVIGTFVIGWLPAIVRFILYCKNCVVRPPTSKIVTISLGVLANVLILLKCFIDPIIYAARTREIRMGLWALLFTRCGIRRLGGMSRSRTLRMTLSYASR